jgi:integrase/recombinase XerD
MDPVARSLAAVIAELPSPNSRRVYESVWRRYATWLSAQSVDVLDAKPRDVAAHLAHLRDEKKKKSTVSHALSIVREVYSALVRDEVLETNPAREVKKPKMDANLKAPWLSATQLEQLLASPAASWKERRERVCTCLLVGLGFRRVEVARLRVEDFQVVVEQSSESLTVTAVIKGGRTITVGVPAWLRAELDAWLAFAGITKGPVLTRSEKDRRSVSADIVYHIVVGLAARTGVKINPHGLRRTTITLTGERGATLKERQLAVGHASQSTTELYDRAREAAANAPGELLANLIRRK